MLGTIMRTLPLLLAMLCCGSFGEAAPFVTAYVGTGTESPSEGIYAFRFDEADGALEPLGLAATTPNPAFLVMSPDGRFLYAVNEATRDNKSNGRTVVAFAVEGGGPQLKFIDKEPCGGDRPVAIAIDPKGRFVFVANFASGTTSALRIRPDGGVDSPEFVFQDPYPVANSLDPRSSHGPGPHVHHVAVAPDGRFVYACELGSNQIEIFRFDSAAGTVARNSVPDAFVRRQAGPRHLAIAPDGKAAYVLNEPASTLCVFERRLDNGALAGPKQEISTLPPGWSSKNTGAEIAVHPSGRFLYTSNRGSDSIALFSIDRGRHPGMLAFEGVTPCGRNPRHFAIDPTGTFLLAEALDDNAINVFRVDAESGKLSPAGGHASVVMPACLVFGK